MLMPMPLLFFISLPMRQQTITVLRCSIITCSAKFHAILFFYYLINIRENFKLVMLNPNYGWWKLRNANLWVRVCFDSSQCTQQSDPRCGGITGNEFNGFGVSFCSRPPRFHFPLRRISSQTLLFYFVACGNGGCGASSSVCMSMHDRDLCHSNAMR